jgi:hypothetical protein
MNLLIARGAYREAALIYPEDLIELRQGARRVEHSREQVAFVPLGTNAAMHWSKIVCTASR